jgi:hypothetical protein
MNIPDADTLWILVPCGLLLVAQVLDWCGVELGERPEPRGFEVIERSDRCE